MNFQQAQGPLREQLARWLLALTSNGLDSAGKAEELRKLQRKAPASLAGAIAEHLSKSVGWVVREARQMIENEAIGDEPRELPVAEPVQLRKEPRMRTKISLSELKQRVAALERDSSPSHFAEETGDVGPLSHDTYSDGMEAAQLWDDLGPEHKKYTRLTRQQFIDAHCAHLAEKRRQQERIKLSERGGENAEIARAKSRIVAPGVLRLS